MKPVSYLISLFFLGAMTASVHAQFTKFSLTCDMWQKDKKSNLPYCTRWSLCPEGMKPGSEGCTSWGKLSFEARDILRDYLTRQVAENLQRKEQGKIYVECSEKDGSQRCNLAYLVKQCTAPANGECSALIVSLGNTASCTAYDGAECTAKMRLRLEDLGKFKEQMRAVQK